MKPVMRFIALAVALSLPFSLPTRADPVAQPPGIARAVIPIYPAQARRDGIEGTVVLRVEVLADGLVGAVDVQASSGSAALDAAAVAGAKRSTFRAATDASGGSIATWMTLPYRFVLQ